MTKIISLDDSEKLVKDSSDCRMSNGIAETITMPFSELPDFITQVRTNQAVGWGISSQSIARIISQKQMGDDSSDNGIPRTKANFFYRVGQAGVSLLDSDFGKDPAKILSIIACFFPEFEYAAKIIKPSVSAFLFRKSK